MKSLVMGFMLILFCGGCAKGRVDFMYFNQSTNEIWVTEIVGLPREASPGRLAPVHDEDQLSEKSCTYFGTIRIAGKLKIEWQDGGKQGWPGGEYAPKGISHELVLKRDDLGLPVTLNDANVHFTYLGGDHWRVKLREK